MDKKFNSVLDQYLDNPDQKDSYDFGRLVDYLVSPQAKNVRDTLGYDLFTAPTKELYQRFEPGYGDNDPLRRLRNAETKAGNLLASEYYHTKDLPSLAKKMGRESGLDIGQGEGHDVKLTIHDKPGRRGPLIAGEGTEKEIDIYPEGKNPTTLIHEVGHARDKGVSEHEENYPEKSTPRPDDLYTLAQIMNNYNLVQPTGGGHHLNVNSMPIEETIGKFRKMYKWMPDISGETEEQKQSRIKKGLGIL